MGVFMGVFMGVREEIQTNGPKKILSCDGGVIRVSGG